MTRDEISSPGNKQQHDMWSQVRDADSNAEASGRALRKEVIQEQMKLQEEAATPKSPSVQKTLKVKK